MMTSLDKRTDYAPADRDSFAVSASSSPATMTAHRFAYALTALLMLQACSTVGDGAESTYDSVASWAESGVRTTARTVVSTTGDVVGIVLFGLPRGIVFYPLGLSSGPSQHKSNPTGFDNIWNGLEGGVESLFGLLEKGTTELAGTAVHLALQWGKIVVVQGGKVIGYAGEQVYALGKDTYKAIPPITGMAEGASSSSGSSSRTVMRPLPSPQSAPFASTVPYQQTLTVKPYSPAPANKKPFDYNEPTLHSPAK